ncbi:phosphoenolpyruvate carboxylase [Patescibacteria group bacterium]|nr:phosphoenolpyruvate carboxylase [Patescibacteria group bacterium]
MGNRLEGNRSFGGIKPMGQLGEILTRYEAPTDVQGIIARRAGMLIGTGISHSHVERVIQESMGINGIPRWNEVTARISDAARDAYRGNRRF